MILTGEEEEVGIKPQNGKGCGAISIRCSVVAKVSFRVVAKNRVASQWKNGQ